MRSRIFTAIKGVRVLQALLAGMALYSGIRQGDPVVAIGAGVLLLYVVWARPACCLPSVPADPGRQSAGSSVKTIDNEKLDTTQ